jgi:hypothetical protein
MTARAWLHHAGVRGGLVFRGSASRKGEQRFIGPDDKRDPAPAAGRGRRGRPERPVRRGTDDVAPPAREEYPGPQTSSKGEHIEPGETRPSRRSR